MNSATSGSFIGFASNRSFLGLFGQPIKRFMASRASCVETSSRFQLIAQTTLRLAEQAHLRRRFAASGPGIVKDPRAVPARFQMREDLFGALQITPAGMPASRAT